MELMKPIYLLSAPKVSEHKWYRNLTDDETTLMVKVMDKIIKIHEVTNTTLLDPDVKEICEKMIGIYKSDKIWKDETLPLNISGIDYDVSCFSPYIDQSLELVLDGYRFCWYVKIEAYQAETYVDQAIEEFTSFLQNHYLNK